MRVAIIHYWLVGMRGGERVIEELCAMYPGADIFTHVYDPASISDIIRGHKVQTSFIQKLPGARKHYQKYIGFMPRALEQLDLSEYDLVISSESGPAKGVVTRPDARHICYCHSPMRYIWDRFTEYHEGIGNPVARTVFAMVAHRLRQWDVSSAARVDRFVVNSTFVGARVRRYYGRSSEVVYPPVSLEAFSPGNEPREHYLFIGQLVRYKRAHLAIEAFRGLGDRKLIVAGDGEERASLEAGAPANVEFAGRVTDEELKRLYRTSRAVIFPGIEDFGIVPVEAMASGTPVIAYDKGGAIDTVTDGVTGRFFNETNAASLRRAIIAFERDGLPLNSNEIAERARKFSRQRFREDMSAVIEHEMSLAPHQRWQHDLMGANAPRTLSPAATG